MQRTRTCAFSGKLFTAGHNWLGENVMDDDCEVWRSVRSPHGASTLSLFFTSSEFQVCTTEKEINEFAASPDLQTYPQITEISFGEHCALQKSFHLFLRVMAIKCPNLNRLSLKAMCIYQPLCRVIAAMNLEQIAWYACWFRPDVFRLFLQQVLNIPNPRLRSLVLTCCRIRDETAVALATVLCDDTLPLVGLSLFEVTCMTPAGYNVLLRAVATNTTLRDVDTNTIRLMRDGSAIDNHSALALHPWIEHLSVLDYRIVQAFVANKQQRMRRRYECMRTVMAQCNAAARRFVKRDGDDAIWLCVLSFLL